MIFTPINTKSISENNLANKSSNLFKNKRFATFLPIGFLHSQLLRLCIAISALHIDTEITDDGQWVKLIIEGEPDQEDIAQIAKLIIPKIDDLSLNQSGWQDGYVGLIQVILLSYFQNSCKKIKSKIA